MVTWGVRMKACQLCIAVLAAVVLCTGILYARRTPQDREVNARERQEIRNAEREAREAGDSDRVVTPVTEGEVEPENTPVKSADWKPADSEKDPEAKKADWKPVDSEKQPEAKKANWKYDE